MHPIHAFGVQVHCPGEQIGDIWLDTAGRERLRFMRPNGENPSASQQHLCTTGDDRDRSVELSFGPNFGGVAFSYGAVAGFIRHARAEDRNGDWIYRDAHTGESFDFARPFACALDPS